VGGPGSAPPAVSALAQQSLYPHSPAPDGQFLWSASTPEYGSAEEEQAQADLWERIRSDLSWQQIEDPRVDKARDAYLKQHNYMPILTERGSLYLYYIVEEVQKRNLPVELALVPMVESTLDPFAYSSGSAAGLWQIMPATGEHLGLQQDWWFDGRRAVRDSTQVALNYLETLYEMFDHDWLLALAAYNAGEGRVSRAQKENQRKGLPTDYWSLNLPRETRRYVPRVLALTQIVAEPDTLDVDIPPLPNEPAFEVVQLDGQIELAQAAELADISLETLRELNPGQLRWATAPNQPHELLVPLGTGSRLEEEIAQLTPAERVRWRYYYIKPGDNLVTIAKKFRTDVDLLRRVNGINDSSIRAGSTLMIPSSDWTAGLAFANAPVEPAIGYKVRRGDSLARIAGKYRVSVDDIVAWNSLDPRKFLQPGQTLKLHVNGR
jgi:membrane-bound lytic murein transglycosylase D